MKKETIVYCTKHSRDVRLPKDIEAVNGASPILLHVHNSKPCDGDEFTITITMSQENASARDAHNVLNLRRLEAEREAKGIK